MSEAVTIREATPEDAGAIWAVLEPAFRAGDTYTVDADITRDDALAYWFGGERTVFVAEAGGAVVGTYYIRPNQAGAGRHVCNCGYVTAIAARGRGVARAMLTHSLDFAPGQGYRAMQYNFVVSTNTRAVETWTRAGFATVGRLPGAFHHPTQGYVDALVMMKPLTGDPE
jgi:ribosomal protein S18 acetylase RimI-like enzyme